MQVEASSESSSPLWVLGVVTVVAAAVVAVVVVVFGLSPPLIHPSGGWSKAAHSPVPRKKNTLTHSSNTLTSSSVWVPMLGPVKGKDRVW